MALALFGALFATNANAFIGNVGKSTVKKADGTVDANSIEKRFLNVLNKQGSTIAAGSVVALDLTADDGASVILSGTAGHAPLCVMAVSCSAAALCKCQNYGYATALFDSTNAPAVTGMAFYMSTSNAGYISARSVPVFGTDWKGGVFYDAASASASVEVFLNM